MQNCLNTHIPIFLSTLLFLMQMWLPYYCSMLIHRRQLESKILSVRKSPYNFLVLGNVWPRPLSLIPHESAHVTVNGPSPGSLRPPTACLFMRVSCLLFSCSQDRFQLVPASAITDQGQSTSEEKRTVHFGHVWAAQLWSLNSASDQE